MDLIVICENVIHAVSSITVGFFNMNKIAGKTARADIDYLDTWRAMEKLVKSGRVRSIGLSNFNSEQTDRVLFFAKIKPVTNQVATHHQILHTKKINETK